ncbi:exported hypothetical protein [Corynebacterium striatum]|nr:exported hypothetical protein [Corynebacterium striatum]
MTSSRNSALSLMSTSPLATSVSSPAQIKHTLHSAATAYIYLLTRIKRITSTPKRANALTPNKTLGVDLTPDRVFLLGLSEKITVSDREISQTPARCARFNLFLSHQKFSER